MQLIEVSLINRTSSQMMNKITDKINLRIISVSKKSYLGNMIFLKIKKMKRYLLKSCILIITLEIWERKTLLQTWRLKEENTKIYLMINRATKIAITLEICLRNKIINLRWSHWRQKATAQSLSFMKIQILPLNQTSSSWFNNCLHSEVAIWFHHK